MRALGGRPAPPVTFQTKAAEALARLEVRVTTLAAQDSPDDVLRDDDIESSIWGDWPSCKRPFVLAQEKHCGYCEARIAGHPTHIDHRAPKLQVADLIEPGVENGSTGEVRGRRFGNPRRGYWWRAYDWSNYVATCFRCNSTWKATLFPLATGPRAADPVRGAEEEELLLDPFVEPESAGDPVKHLRFDDKSGVPGQVYGLTSAGKATIETCGLDRPSLVDARSEKAGDVSDLIEAMYSEGDQTRTLRLLVEKGAAGREFAGMVRAMVRAELDLPWAQLCLLAGTEEAGA